MDKLQHIVQDFQNLFDSENGWKSRKMVIKHLKSLQPGVNPELFVKVVKFLGATYYPLFSDRITPEYLPFYAKIVQEESNENQHFYNLFYKYSLIAISRYLENQDIKLYQEAMKYGAKVYRFDSDIHRVAPIQLVGLNSSINPSSVSCCEALLESNYYISSQTDKFHNIFLYAVAHANSKDLPAIISTQLSNTNDFLGTYKIFAILDIFKSQSNVTKPYELVFKRLLEMNKVSSMKQWMDQFHKFDQLTSWTVYLRVAEGKVQKDLDPHHAPNNVRIWISNIISPHFKVTVSKQVVIDANTTTDKWHTINYKYAPNERLENFKSLINESLRNLSMSLNWQNLALEMEINLVRRENVPKGVKNKIMNWIQNQT